MICIVQGKSELEIDGRREPIHAGDVIVVEPGEAHYIHADPETPTVNCWFRADDRGHPR